MPAPKIAVGPAHQPWIAEAVLAGGGEPTEALDQAEGLVWTDGSDPQALRRLLDEHPAVRWVQLPAAGVERYAAAGILDERHDWTCAKGSYGEPVAEHTLLLALAGLRLLPDRVRASSWGKEAGTSLYDQEVAILGGGGIGEALLGLLAPFRVRATVVRRGAAPVPGAARTLPSDRLLEALPGALVVFVALPLTPATTKVISQAALARMDARAWLVNVGRGRLVDTDALVAALASRTIGGAALDVTDPEPLPDGHPLWTAPNCIVTPHTADTWEMIQPLLAHRITENVRNLATGERLVGRVDPLAGY